MHDGALSNGLAEPMIPTLLGRWHTRLLLFVCIGVPVSVIYSAYLGAAVAPPRSATMFGTRFDPLPLIVIGLITLVGFVLDPVYIVIQRTRWDRDWPFAFQFMAMIVEFLIVLGILHTGWSPLGLGGRVSEGDYFYVFLHYATVFTLSFVALLGLIQILLVRWRYKGGELGGL